MGSAQDFLISKSIQTTVNGVEVEGYSEASFHIISRSRLLIECPSYRGKTIPILMQIDLHSRCIDNAGFVPGL